MKKFLLIAMILGYAHFGFGQFITYQPQILGGIYNYNLILSQEFYYPPEAIKAGIEGEVKISFIVGIDRQASEFVIIESIHPKLDSAYIEILKRCLWIPGTHDGAISAMRISKKEKFKIKKYQKIIKKREYDQPPYQYKPYNSSVKIVDYNQLETIPNAFYKNKKVNIYQFISEYINIPGDAVKQGLNGVVELVFIIEPSGRLSNFNEIIGVGGGCTEEAIRLMQLLSWEPGKQNGEYVRSFYHVKVNFGNTKY